MRLAKGTLIVNIAFLILLIFSIKNNTITGISLLVIVFFIAFNGVISVIGFYKAVLLSREKELRDNIKNLEILNSRLRGQRHEALNHIQILNGLIELGEFDEARKYISPLFEDIAEMKRGIKSGIGRLDAFILGEITKAKERNIEFRININNALKEIIIPEIDLCSMFKECLENSYLSLSSSEPGRINIDSRIDEKDNSFIIRFHDNGRELPKSIKNEMNIIKLTRAYKESIRKGYGFKYCRNTLNSLGGRIRYGYYNGNIIELVIPNATLEEQKY
ncbi:sensor histidine kinase [Clostridium massiliamazoniense]|uniref:sensor histidine kinase n=1 Tax=Clostridium massiliamazoniense TaxID=1347366 RepID=UPI0006D78103|nr:Spo0B domain-containing protein [Clostridium massiliamazoniense]